MLLSNLTSRAAREADFETGNVLWKASSIHHCRRVCDRALCANSARAQASSRDWNSAALPPRAGSPCPVRAIEGARVINYIKAVAELPLGSCCWTKRACFRPHRRLPDLHLWPRARAKRMFWPVAFTTPALAQMSSTPLSYRVILCSPVCLLASCAVAA